MNNPTPARRAQLATWGSLGGRSASGTAKKRTPEHYKIISLLGVEARKAKKQLKAPL
jgi:hypothetical protein